MNPAVSEELISAYFDGEVTPAEQAVVERWLAESPDRRQEFEEIGQLSALLHSLPTPDAPDELAAATMQRIERETLLAPSSATAPRRTARRERVVAFSAFLVTVAATVLVMLTSRSWMPQTDMVAMTESPALPASRTEGLADSLDRAAPPGPVPARGENATAFREGAESQVSAGLDVARSERERLSPSPKSEAQSAPASAANPVDERLAGQPSERMLLKERDLRIGSVIPYLETSGDTIALIEVTVVDVRQAAGEMQVLLRKNAVPAADSAEPGQTQPKPSGSDADQLIAVYVEGTRAQLAAILDSMERQDTVLGMTLQPPLELQEVQQHASASEPQLDPAAVAGALVARNTLALNVENGSQKAVDSPTNSVGIAQKQQAAAKDDDASPPAAPAEALAQRSLLNRAYQQIVPLPREASPTLGRDAIMRNRFAQVPLARAQSVRNSARIGNTAAPIRVLFLLQPPQATP